MSLPGIGIHDVGFGPLRLVGTGGFLGPVSVGNPAILLF
jgi:hypothetical protein